MDCTDLEKRLFWGCIQMETRYGQDMRLPDSGLTTLELVTEMYTPLHVIVNCSIPKTDGMDCSSHLYHSSSLFHCLPRFAIKAANLLYCKTPYPIISPLASEHPNMKETPELLSLEHGMHEWYVYNLSPPLTSALHR